MTQALGNPYALGATGVQTATRTDRLALGSTFRPGSAALSAASGLLHGPAGTRGDLTLLTDVLLRIDPFLAIVQGTHNTQQGQYLVPNVSQRDLAVPAKDASLFRKALVRVRVADSLEAGVASSGTTDGSWLEVVSGVLAASSPALPPLGDNAVALGELSIPSTASAQPVTLTRYYPRTVARGGSLPLPTEAAISALPTALLWEGFQAYAEDTDAYAVWDGTRFLFYDTRWQTYTPTMTVGVSTAVLGNALVACRYFRKGREVTITGHIQLGSTTTFGGGNGIIYIDYPAGLRPYFPLPTATSPHTMGGGARLNGSTFGSGWCLNMYHATPASRRMWFVNLTDIVTQGGAGGGINLTAAGHWIDWQCTYETAFEA